MQVYLGLGSNLGDRQATMEKAIKFLRDRLQIELVSSIYETEPVGYEEQPLFLNAVCCGQTELGPLQLLSLVKGIEASLGRVPSFPNAPRTIDVDIIFYGNMIMQTPELTIPHPRLEERAFVLIPLLEIAPDLCHPVSGESIRHLVAGVQGREGVRKIGELGVGDV
jgi:2-amino-4-hydroxy-6-hydroxymethyldihydropteridine diphosphokinase